MLEHLTVNRIPCLWFLCSGHTATLQMAPCNSDTRPRL